MYVQMTFDDNYKPQLSQASTVRKFFIRQLNGRNFYVVYQLHLYGSFDFNISIRKLFYFFILEDTWKLSDFSNFEHSCPLAAAVLNQSISVNLTLYTWHMYTCMYICRCTHLPICTHICTHVDVHTFHQRSLKVRQRPLVEGGNTIISIAFMFG